MSKVMVRDLDQQKPLDRQARIAVVGGRLSRGYIGTVDGGPGTVFISDWQMFTLQMEGKVTYK